MEQFAGYGFNKSHSAAYALVAYQTAYLKTHYPVEFMSALLTSEIGNQDKLTRYLNECKDMGIGILPPDVNSSDLAFTPAGHDIRFGLTAIKNVGATAIESVLAARQKLGRFDNLIEFCENVDLRLLNKRVLESLIKAGAFDSLGARRAQLLPCSIAPWRSGQKRQRESESGQHGLFVGGSDAAPPPPFDLPDVPEWTEAERLAGEKEVLGFYVTGHPLEKYTRAPGHADPARHILHRGDGARSARDSGRNSARLACETQQEGRPLGQRATRGPARLGGVAGLSAGLPATAGRAEARRARCSSRAACGTRRTRRRAWS